MTREKHELVDCPRCQGGRLQPFMGDYEGAIGCRLCCRNEKIPAYLAAAYRLLSDKVSPTIPGAFFVEELRNKVTKCK